MHVRGGTKLQSRRKPSLGPLRRAHPASGATWNVQVVRGKMTSRCLWHACRALVLGLVLMSLGAGMATIGYYANDLAGKTEIRNNVTVKIRTENRGVHLNNLSYVGPIVMGVGGFIVVASCVMTFEARDSAAKVVPARFKVSSTSSNRRSGAAGTPTTQSSQTTRWEQHLGVFKGSPSQGEVPPPPPQDRRAMTAALIHFSKHLGSPNSSQSRKNSTMSTSSLRRLSHTGSFPNLDSEHENLVLFASPNRKKMTAHLHLNKKRRPKTKESRVRSLVQRSTREISSGLLHPAMLNFHRQALSVDETGLNFNDSLHGSQNSVTFDPVPTIVNANDLLAKKIRERPKRSDTARRHMLVRQKTVDEMQSPYRGKHHEPVRRHNSTLSNPAPHMNKSSRRFSQMSRAASIDARSQTTTTVEISTESILKSARPMPASTPSVDSEFRSQLSICSEPPLPLRQMSCQSSFGPESSVPEETTDLDEKEPQTVNKSPEPIASDTSSSSTNRKLRPDSLILRTNLNLARQMMEQQQMDDTKRKYLCRSQSTKQFDKAKKPKPKQLSNEFDQIYTLSSFSDHREDDNYDSIEVIHERRVKNFSKFNSGNTGLQLDVVVAPTDVSPPNGIAYVVPTNNEDTNYPHSVLTIDIEAPKKLSLEGDGTLANLSPDVMKL